MKKLLNVLLLSIAIVLTTSSFQRLNAQCEPFIRIDGEIVIANETVPTGLALPLWLKAGQTLSVGLTVRSVSVIEFNEAGTSLEYSQVLSITSALPLAVPAGKVWKVESIVKKPTIGGGVNRVEYLMAGSNTFTVPSCAEYICIEAWGGGGGGQGGKYTTPYRSGGGGGGGAYGQGCFDVVPGTTYTVSVGAGGLRSDPSSSTPPAGSDGGNSSVGTLITAYGGKGGTNSGGLGGTSNGAVSISGFVGLPGIAAQYSAGGNGGYGGNGGAGGLGVSNSNATNPSAPGGGGAGGDTYGYNGSHGAQGKVIITW